MRTEVIIATSSLTPRRPDVATPACVAGNGGMGSPGNNVLLTTSYRVVSRLAKSAYEERQRELLVNLVMCQTAKVAATP